MSEKLSSPIEKLETDEDGSEEEADFLDPFPKH
jgi:hypothetical protein